VSYTDPSGFFFKAIGSFIGKFWQPILAIGITVVSAGIATGALFASLEVVGTSAAWGVAIGGGALAGLVNSGNLRGALYGAFSAAAFHGVGTYFSNIKGAAAKNLGRFGNFVKDNLRLTKTIAHGLTGGIMNELQGGKFAHGFLSAGATQALAPSIESIGIGDGSIGFGDRALRVAAAAAVGGTVSEVTGGKFANGAVTGAFSRAFNDELRDRQLQQLFGSPDEDAALITDKLIRHRRALLLDEVVAYHDRLAEMSPDQVAEKFGLIDEFLFERFQKSHLRQVRFMILGLRGGVASDKLDILTQSAIELSIGKGSKKLSRLLLHIPAHREHLFWPNVNTDSDSR